MAEGQDDARIAEIRARLEAATPGPWGYNSYSGVFGPPDLCAADDGPDYPESPRPTPGSPEDRVWVAQRSAAYEADPRVCKVPALYGDTAIGRHAADAAFISHAREDVPYLLARLDALTAEAADVARENETLIDEVKAAGEQITALAAERDELRSAGLRLIEVRDRAVDGADRAFREGDAAAARAERAEAALREIVACAFTGDEARLMLVVTGGTKVSESLLARCDRVNTALEAARAALAGSREQAASEEEEGRNDLPTE